MDLEIIRLYPWMRLFSIVQGLSLVIFVWFLSVEIVFQERLFDIKLFSIASIEVAYLAIKLWVLRYDERFDSEAFELQPKAIKQPIVIMVSCILMTLNNEINIQAVKIIINILMFAVCFYLGMKVPKYFKVIKNYAEQNKLIKELRIIELFCVLLVVTHIFGLIMYSAVYLRKPG